MQLICPECMGALESADGRQARCTVHGGRYAILFARQPIVAPARARSDVTYSLVPGTACARHPSSPADYACTECGTPICGVCSFDEAGDVHLCPSCAQRRAVSGPPAAVVVASREPPIAAGVRCVQHPQLAATARCKTCGAFMCDTCKFEVPGGIYLCPSCATNPRSAMSSKQKLMLAGSFIAAVWCTLVMGAMFAGVFRQMMHNKEEEQAVGLLIMVILIAPAITGLSLGVGAMRRRQGTPIAVWIATIWNGAILGMFLLLIIIGMLSK